MTNLFWCDIHRSNLKPVSTLCIRHAVVKNVHQHWQKEQIEGASQSFQSSKSALNRSSEYAEPQVTVHQVLFCLLFEQVFKFGHLLFTTNRQNAFDSKVRFVYRQPVFAEKIELFSDAEISHHNVLKIPTRFDSLSRIVMPDSNRGQIAQIPFWSKLVWKENTLLKKAFNQRFMRYFIVFII